MGNGFEVALDELQRVGDSALPALRDIMSAQLPVLNAHEGLAGSGTLDWARCSTVLRVSRSPLRVPRQGSWPRES